MLLLAISQKYLRNLRHYSYQACIGMVAVFGLSIGIVVWASGVIIAGHIMKIMTAMQAPASVEVVYTHIYAQTLKDAIDQQVGSLVAQSPAKGCRPDRLVKALRKEFPIIHHVSWDARDHRVARCHIVGIEPCARINTNLVLGKNGQLYSHLLFLDDSLALGKQLYLPNVSAGEKLSTDIIHFCENIESELCLGYDMCYHSAHEIILLSTDAKNNHAIICTQENIMSGDIAHAQQRVSFHAHAQASSPLGKDQYYFCDIRYKGRAIISSRDKDDMCGKAHKRLLVTVRGGNNG